MLSAPSATAVERPARSADGGCVSGLEDELRQLAVQRATIDDLSFAYQLQLEEVLRASAENAGLAVSPRMFAPESEECLQRRAAVEAQVALHNAALAVQADKAVALKVYTEQAEHVQEACRDHELAKNLHVKGDIALQQHTKDYSTNAPARVRAICCAINSHITGTMGYAAALCAPAGDVIWFGRGTVKSPLRQAAELKGLLHGLQKARENAIDDLLMCTRSGLLTQVLDTSEPQSSGVAEAIAALQAAMAELTVEGKALDDSDLRLLMQIKASRESCKVNKSLYATVDNADKGSDHKREPAKALPVPDVDETKHTCDICMDDLPAAAMHSVGTCMHQFCKGCLERHIQTHMRSRPLPVVCPAVKCRSGIDADECSVLLHNKEDIALLTQMEAEAKIPASAKFWCPKKECSNLLIVKKSTHLEASKVDDSDALSLAQKKGWRRCPTCRHVIERDTGCNHIKCRCGAEMCYACGKPYVKGQRQCRCDLFKVPSEDTEPLTSSFDGLRVSFSPARSRASSTTGSRSIFGGKGKQPDPALYKTVICRNWRSGDCSYGARCAFAHGARELRTAPFARYAVEGIESEGSEDMAWLAYRDD
ncbi:hypothetical protein ABBQ32_010441 [Trebouxia sp. C0010 RCD-2024]